MKKIKFMPITIGKLCTIIFDNALYEYFTTLTGIQTIEGAFKNN